MNIDFDNIYLLIGIILFISTFIRSAFGFGDAVIAMPLLSMIIGLQLATPLVAFIAVTSSLIIVIKNHQHVDFQATWRLVLSSLVGIPFGLLLLKGISDNWAKLVLGACIVLFGLYNIVKPSLKLDDKRGIISLVIGIFAGILGGAYNTNGPLVVIYGKMKHWPPGKFRNTLQGYFLFTGFSILIGHGLAGLWTTEVIKLYLLVLPVVLIAIYTGDQINSRVSSEKFNQIVNILLIIIGLILLFKSACLIVTL